MGRQYLTKYSGKHVLLQPHLDDLPFSASYFLKESIPDRTACKAFTLFGREFFNVRGYPKEESTVELLKAEEKAWFLQAGIKYNRFELEEAGYRGVDSIRKLFQPRLANDFLITSTSVNLKDWDKLLLCIEQTLTEKPEYLWIPSGTGGHCDHLAVRQAALAAAGHCDTIKGLIIYEELPYSMYSKKIIWEKVEIPGFYNADEITFIPTEQDSLQKENELSVFYSQITKEQLITLSQKKESLSIWKKG